MMPLKKTISKPRVERAAAAFGAFILFPAAEVVSAAPCDYKNNPPAFTRHNLADGYGGLCAYGDVTVVIANACNGAGAWTSARMPGLGRLESRSGLNQLNTAKDHVPHKAVLPGGPLCLFTSFNITDFIATSDFAAGIGSCSWRDTHERCANTSIYLGGEIQTCA
jgi:hypothetical protein